jgi:hypothetical protein
VPQYFLDGHSIFWTAAVFFGRPQYFLDDHSIFWTAAVFLDGRSIFWMAAGYFAAWQFTIAISFCPILHFALQGRCQR